MARGFGASSSRVAGASSSSSSVSSSRGEAPSPSLGASRVWTPLRENHFEPPLLSSRERAYLVRKACEAAQELVERARSAGGPIAWRHVEKNNGVQIYAGSARSSPASGAAAVSAASMCGVTSVPGTVKEVAALFQLGSTRQMKEFARAHREWFYDGVVLHTLAPRTKEKPLHQVTAKWMVAQMPGGLAHRDFCFLECQDKFIDARGRKGWVLGQHSIKLPGCDELKREFGLVRGSLYHSGLVVVESEERAGHVDVIHLVQLNLKERAQTPVNLLRARVLFVAQVRNMLRSKRLNEQRYLSDLELVPRKYRARCAVCQDSFSLLLLRKLNCRKCGEVVCAACSKEFPIENRNFAATNGGDEVRKLRICMHCFQVITNAPKPTSALVEPPHSSTMAMSFLGYHDDDRRASHMTLRMGHHGRREAENEAPKIFLQSMHREKPSRRRMSSTSPIPGFGADMPPSTSRHRTRGEPDSDLYERSQRYQQQQQQDYGRTHNHRTSQRMRPSDFRPSQSLSLDDPIARGEGRYTLQMPGPPPVQSPASIFDRPANPPTSRRQQNGLPRSNSSDMLLGTGSRNMSNFSRLQELSSRERLAQLQREGNYMSRSSIDYRMPDAYMSALHQASRDKRDFDAAPSTYAAPPSDFGAYGATLQVTPPDFGPYESSLDDPDAPPPLDMSALTTSASTIPIELNSSTGIRAPPAPVTPSRDGGRERELLRRREREIEQRRESTSSDSSASSIDIDTYEDPTNLSVVPPIAEQHKSLSESPDVKSAQNGMKSTRAHDTDEDSETSMGASDEERRVSAKIAPTSSMLPPRRPVDDNAEETKAQEFVGTPALPPPSPSAHTATRQVLERPSIANSTAGSLSGDAAPVEVEGKEGVEITAPKESEAVEEDLIDHEHQLQGSKVEDLIDHEHQLQRSKVEDLIDHEHQRQPSKVEDLIDHEHLLQRSKVGDLIDREHELQRSKVEDLIDHEYQQNQVDDDVKGIEQRVSGIAKGTLVNEHAKKYSFQERYGNLETEEDLLNTAGCDMNYLDADMRQFHDQSLFIRQSRDGGAPSLRSSSSQMKNSMSAVLSTPSEAASIRSSLTGGDANGVTPPYEHMPTSPKGDTGKTVDLAKPSQPTIPREGTFALELMSMDGSQQSWNSRDSSADHVALDDQTTPNEKSSPSAASSSTRTDDRFALTGSSLVSGPVNSVVEDLVFEEDQRDSEVPRLTVANVDEDLDSVFPPPVISVSVASTDDDGTVQTSGDDVLESRSRASSRVSFSSLPSSDGRRSSVCSMSLDAVTPPATPPSVSPVAIGRLSATSASSPVAAPALDLEGSEEASITEAPRRNSNGAAPPAYVPDRFRTMDQLQVLQQQQKEEPVVSNTPRQSTDSNGTLDNFQLNFSASFNAHQEQKPHSDAHTSEGIDGLARLPPPAGDDRNRASSTGSNDVQVLRYQSVGSSVLDTVPDSARLSVSDDDDSEDENMLLSARKLYGQFGNTKQLSRLGGNRPGFQHTLSQIQQSFDQLSSDSEDEEDTPAAPRR